MFQELKHSLTAFFPCRMDNVSTGSGDGKDMRRQLKSPEHTEQLIANIDSMRLDASYSDVVISIDDHKFPCHKVGYKTVLLLSFLFFCFFCFNVFLSCCSSEMETQLTVIIPCGCWCMKKKKRFFM